MASTRYTKANSEYSYSTSPPPGDTDYSAGGWVRFVSRANTDTFFFLGPSDGDFPGDYDVIQIAGAPAVYWQITCADNYSEDTSNYNDSIANDTWYHVMFVAEGGTSRLYVNGVERCSVSHTRSSRTDAGHLRFGSGMNYHNKFDGELAGWKVWDRALTAAEAAAEAQSYMPVQTRDLRGAWPLLAGSRTADWGGLGLTLTEVNTPTDGTATPPPIAFRRMPFVGVPPAASGGGTGELSASIATTLSATGTLPITGASSTTVATTISAAGTLPIVGTAAGSVSTTLAATGVLPIVGTLSATVDTTLSASSSAAITGAATPSVDTTVSATGVLPILGTGQDGLAVSTTLSATGTSAITGLASVTVTTSLSATGTLPINGSLSATVTTTLSASAATPRSGAAAVTITTTLVAAGEVASSDWLAQILVAIREVVIDALDGVALVQENAPPPATAAQWATVSIVFDSAAKATIGAAHTRSTGYVEVTIYAARARGDADILTIGERVIDALQAYDSAAPYVRCRNAAFLGPQGYRDAWSSRTVRAAVMADVF